MFFLDRGFEVCPGGIYGVKKENILVMTRWFDFNDFYEIFGGVFALSSLLSHLSWPPETVFLLR